MNISKQLNEISKSLDFSNDNRLLFIVPASAGDIFLSTSLLRGVSETYPEYDIYFACLPQFQDILKNNPYIKKIINYDPIMDQQVIMEGYGEWKGLFKISFYVPIMPQKVFQYYNNNEPSRIMFDIRY